MKIRLSEIEASAKDFAEIVFDDQFVDYAGEHITGNRNNDLGYRERCIAKNEQVRPVIEALHRIYQGGTNLKDFDILRDHMRGIVQGYVDAETVVDDVNEEESHCGTCDGTGIGQHGDPNTSRCTSCGGSGVYRDRENDGDADYYYDLKRDEELEKNS